ncbi:vWA domain-containing protein [Aestuariispira insulae]|uniref:VWFA domain-containing protein n=1 Tax=Aestuariispira insulae TaxID=1461337 RepID=A0A3D9HN94_9PROT|nr:VWA domain-containing protein [Aestuariispira insulae]RED50970.1 hypothetical protein DFP90_104243 [Aestuariispira insulae]
MQNPPTLPCLPETGEAQGRLDENIMHFGRVLRQAGLPVGPGKILDALKAVEAVGLENRDDFYWALHAVLVNRQDQRLIFDQAFHFFWRNPKLLDRMMGMLLPTFRGEELLQQEDEILRRIAEALAPSDSSGQVGQNQPDQDEDTRIELDASLTYSAREQLAEKDFEKMSLDELASVRAVMKRLALPMKPYQTRRFQAHANGRKVDMRNSMRASARRGGEGIWLKYRRQRTVKPPLVVLCDISGSMDRYARTILFYLHALSNDRDRVHTFLFGTRLTNISRHLRRKDPDQALDLISKQVQDWSGGTRIGDALQSFNKDWSRRVLGQGAVVLLITDGLDRAGAEGVSKEMERLHKSCRKLIWLNPLLRFDQYEPKSRGARAIMAHVDEFRPVHNLVSVAQLGQALSGNGCMSDLEMADWKKRAS